jgi:hypothetical protein
MLTFVRQKRALEQLHTALKLKYITYNTIGK